MPGPSDTASTRPPRIAAIDAVRGLVMVLMALDHARIFLLGPTTVPIDVTGVGGAEFVTRWLPHLCAPAFVGLAGTSAFLAQRRGLRGAALSWFLLWRGALLIVLQFTVVHASWYFTLSPYRTFTGILWIIGAGLIVMAALVHLPAPAVGAAGVALVLGTSVLQSLDATGPVAHLLWGGWATVTIAGIGPLGVTFALLPWIGIMAAGYGLGLVMRSPRRATILLAAGAAVVALFLAVRAANGWGNLAPWTRFEGAGRSLMSLLNPSKMPASLAFVLMTTGPALLALAAWGDARDLASRVLAAFGRTPLLFYLLHIPLLHVLALAHGLVAHGTARTRLPVPWSPAPDLPGSLAATWLAAAVACAALYPACVWYGRVKRRSANPLVRML